MAPQTTFQPSLTALHVKDRIAFNQLYSNYSGSLHAHILKMVRNKDTADDLLQDAFIKIWKKLDVYDPLKGSLFTWMHIITRRICIDFLEGSYYKLEGKIVEESMAARIALQPASSRDSEMYDLDNYIYKLDKKLRVIIVMSYHYGHSNEEIASRLNIPIGTVKTRRRNGLKKLKALYE